MPKFGDAAKGASASTPGSWAALGVFVAIVIGLGFYNAVAGPEAKDAAKGAAKAVANAANNAAATVAEKAPLLGRGPMPVRKPGASAQAWNAHNAL